MKIPQMIRAEFARLWATPMARLAFVALMCVPLLYGGLYLWANQDPYAKLDQVPVALVVDDAGVQSGDSTRSIGDEVAKKLIADGSFDWHRVGAQEAADGLKAGEFDFTVTLPKNFSEALESSRSDAPYQAQVILNTNDANSYLASTIGEQAVKRIQQQVVRSVNQEAARALLDGLADVRSSLGEARDGAGAAHEGSGKLVAGLGELQKGTAKLPDQTRKLADGAKQVADGDARVADAGRTVAQVSQRVVDRLENDRAVILQDLKKAGVEQKAIDKIMSRLDAGGQKLRDANTKVQATSDQLDRLEQGSSQLAAGASRLADGTPKLTQGIVDAKKGAASLESGIGKLADGLAAGVEKLPKSTAELRAEQAANLANPVQLKTEQVARAGTYGAGLAPFFVSLAAWIGIYALFLILKPVSRRAVTALHTPVKVAIAGWATPAILGAIQMLAMLGIVAGFLGFKVVNPVSTYGMMALASVTFAAIILALNVWLGSVGQFLGLVLMVLQLVTAGGTFPWQTLPAPLAALHQVLPMGYAVDAIRQFMYGG
ncbi:MAG: YhgE/Pip family protein, partial [Actinobacteria bacterium]|nr:YhgE/Pip family protein [Actinomycetota bacterium]